jgi:hypothetical protein
MPNLEKNLKPDSESGAKAYHRKAELSNSNLLSNFHGTNHFDTPRSIASNG